MNNMNLRRPNDFGCKMNYNFNQGCNPSRNSGCGNKPAPSPAPGCGCDTDCGCNIPMPPCDGGHKPPCGCKPPCGGNKRPRPCLCNRANGDGARENQGQSVRTGLR